MNRVNPIFLHHIVQATKGRKLVLYGSGRTAAQMLPKLCCLGLDVAYCVDDKREDHPLDVPVRDVYDLLLEREPFFVLIVKSGNVRHAVTRLRGMGLRQARDYNTIFETDWHMCLENEYSFDATLGYALPAGRNQRECRAGIRIYGDWKENANRIAILGGSTSDPCIHPWKSWGEQLYEMCVAANRPAVVIVGAVAAYTSSQELLKLIRDILPCQPDTVISWSGINDTYDWTPYVHGFPRGLYQRLIRLKQTGLYAMGTSRNISDGGGFGRVHPADKWLRNQRMMHAIAEEYGIRHIAFFQPNLVDKSDGKLDREILFHAHGQFVAAHREMTDRLRDEIARYPYVVDATHWLDGTDGLFYDYCHVTEEGDRRIAEGVYRYLFEEGEAYNGVSLSD